MILTKLAGMGAIKLSLFVKNTFEKEEALKYKTVLELDKIDENTRIPSIEEYYGEYMDGPFGFIYSLLEERPLALLALELSCYHFLEPGITELLGKIGTTNGKTPGVTLEIAALINGEESIFSALKEIEEAYRVISPLLCVSETGKSSDFIREKLVFDIRLCEFLTGENHLDRELSGLCRILTSDSSLTPMIINQHKKEVLSNKVSIQLEQLILHSTDNKFTHTPINIVISGPKGAGRFTLATHVASENGLGIISIDFDSLLSHTNRREIIARSIRECILLNLSLCIHDIHQDPECEKIVKEICFMYEFLGCRPLIFCSDENVKLLHKLNGRNLACELPMPDLGEAYELWQYYLLPIIGAENINRHELASKMRLTPGQIQKIASAIDTEIKSLKDGDILSHEDIYKICYQILDDGRYQNLRRINSNVKLSDLTLSKDKVEILSDIINSMKDRDFVYSKWNLCSKYSYGRSLSVLLCGPPGTGKTMAVHAVANELGLELYKVDLSQVVDKYIGETEKRLDEIFSTAEKSNMILFFDEADSIFGKRSETQNSHDKYANNEVSFILQRIEEFDGIVFLATNYFQNIDHAFLRRIRYVITIEMPNADERKEIWMNAFPVEVSLDNDIDFDYLANALELSGGNIKNIVQNSIYYAAHNREPVSMRHIIKAVQRDYQKDTRVNFSVISSGPYSSYLNS